MLAIVVRGSLFKLQSTEHTTIAEQNTITAPAYTGQKLKRETRRGWGGKRRRRKRERTKRNCYSPKYRTTTAVVVDGVYTSTPRRRKRSSRSIHTQKKKAEETDWRSRKLHVYTHKPTGPPVLHNLHVSLNACRVTGRAKH